MHKYEEAYIKFKQQIVNAPENYNGYTEIEIKCKFCQDTLITVVNNLKKIRNDYYLCKSCKSKEIWKDTEYRKKQSERTITEKQRQEASERMKELWNEGRFDYLYSDEFSKKMSDIITERWKDPEYRKKLHTEAHLKALAQSQNREQHSKNSKKLWRNEEYRKKCLKAARSEETKKKIAKAKNYEYPPKEKKKLTKEELSELKSINAKKNWQNPEYRKKMARARNTPEFKKKASERTKELWKNREYREKIYKHWRNLPKVSSVAKTFYSLLDDLGIVYYREYNDKPDDPQCKIGPYSWDCVIPREGQKTLLIDVHGDWTHRNSVNQDCRKFNFINNNYSHLYEVKYIWQHELANKDKIMHLIKYWTGKEYKKIEFSFKQLDIRPADAKEYRLLLAKYHYLANAGRGGIAYGAYLDDNLIAICVFSPLNRQNVHQSLGYEKNEIRELSRFCIHPAYQKKNLGSWFISRCMKKLNPKYRCIIAYADTTFNHDGALYKSCNFIHDRIVRPDYWYYSKDGWPMHKQTLYKRAKDVSMTEEEFAIEYEYTKVYGKEKLRFVYKLD